MNRRELAFLAPIFAALTIVAITCAFLMERDAQGRAMERERVQRAHQLLETSDLELSVKPHSPLVYVSENIDTVPADDICDLVRIEVREWQGTHSWAGEYRDSTLGDLCLAPRSGFEWTPASSLDIQLASIRGVVREEAGDLVLLGDGLNCADGESVSRLVPITRGWSRFLVPLDRLQDAVERLQDEATGRHGIGGGFFRRAIDAGNLPQGELVVPEKYRRALFDGVSAELSSSTEHADSHEPGELTIDAGYDEGVFGGLHMYSVGADGAVCEIEVAEVSRGTSIVIERRGEARFEDRFSSIRPRR